jgi:hypothetical protein
MKKLFALAAIPVALLSACGGGGSSTTTTPPPTASAMNFSGTAATGAAIGGGTVDIKCTAGSGSTTTQSDGSYKVSITGATLPCAIHVTAAGIDLYSVADASTAGDVHANITPLSQLVTARISGGDPAALFANFDATAQARITTASVTDAIATVASALKGTIDLTGVDPLKDSLTAANGSTAGNALDQKLDALKAALAAAQVTLADVTATLVASGPDTQAPVQTLLQPAVSSCAGLRSGRYRALNPLESDPAWANHVFSFDVSTMTVKFFDNSTTTISDQGHCSFVTGDGASRLLVSKSGATIALDAVSSTQNTVSLIIPEQTIPLSELAGTWNVLSYQHTSVDTPLKPSMSTFTLDAAGKFTAGSDCAGLGQCTAWATNPGNLTVSSAGGFTYTDADGGVRRAYALKTADGQLSLYVLHAGNLGISVAARQKVQALPELQAVSKFWDLTVASNGLAGVISDTTTTVQTVDAATSSYTRVRASDGRVDGFTVNKPRDGLRYRAAGTSATTAGGSVNFSEIIAMSVPGTGLSTYVSVNPNQSFFGVSVNHD